MIYLSPISCLLLLRFIIITTIVIVPAEGRLEVAPHDVLGPAARRLAFLPVGVREGAGGA